MSKQLAHLLGMTESAATEAVAKLESLSGYPSEDNRLLAESNFKVHSKLQGLKLDPNDTSARELYHSLLAKFDSDSMHLTAINGSSKPSDGAVRCLSAVVKLADMPMDVWAIRRSVAKNILRENPPRKLIRHLGYRSLESLLKREDIDELYAALKYIETPAWQKSFYKKLANLSPSDFEIRSASIVVMPASNWQTVNWKSAVSTVSVLGVVSLWPAAGKSTTHWLGAYLAAIKALESLRLASYSLMAMQTAPSFGKYFSRQIELGIAPPAKIAGQPVHWRTLNHYYGHLPAAGLPLFQEPYLQSLRLHKASPGKLLSVIHPIFRWWADNEHLAMGTTTKPVSLNIADIALNHANSSPYTQRLNYNHRLSLWDELIARYLKYPGVEGYILRQVDKKTNPHKTNTNLKVLAGDFQAQFQLA